MPQFFGKEMTPEEARERMRRVLDIETATKYKTIFEKLEKAPIDQWEPIFKKLEKEARIKWHPDHAPKGKDQEYTELTQDINEAVELLKTEIGNKTRGIGEKLEKEREEKFTKEQRQQADVLRRSVKRMQEKIQESWSKIKNKIDQLERRDEVIAQGQKWADIIDDEIQHATLTKAVGAIATYTIIYVPIALFCGFFLGNSGIGYLFTELISLIMLVSLTSCFLGILPLSRYWLPQPIEILMGFFITVGLAIARFLGGKGIFRPTTGTSAKDNTRAFIGVFISAPIFISKVFEMIVLRPIYFLIKKMLGDRGEADFVRSKFYYAGFDITYIDYLLSKPPEEFDTEEILNIQKIFRFVGGEGA